MNKLRGSLISAFAGAACAIGIAQWQMSFLEDTLSARMTAWSNGFFTAAVLWFGLGALTWIASFGGFDSLRYLGYVFRQKYFARQPHIKSFFDFRLENAEKKNHKPMMYLLLPGMIYLIIAGITAMIAVH